MVQKLTITWLQDVSVDPNDPNVSIFSYLPALAYIRMYKQYGTDDILVDKIYNLLITKIQQTIKSLESISNDDYTEFLKILLKELYIANTPLIDKNLVSFWIDQKVPSYIAEPLKNCLIPIVAYFGRSFTEDYPFIILPYITIVGESIAIDYFKTDFMLKLTNLNSSSLTNHPNIFTFFTQLEPQGTVTIDEFFKQCAKLTIPMVDYRILPIFHFFKPFLLYIGTKNFNDICINKVANVFRKMSPTYKANLRFKEIFYNYISTYLDKITTFKGVVDKDVLFMLLEDIFGSDNNTLKVLWKKISSKALFKSEVEEPDIDSDELDASTIAEEAADDPGTEDDPGSADEPDEDNPDTSDEPSEDNPDEESNEPDEGDENQPEEVKVLLKLKMEFAKDEPLENIIYKFNVYNQLKNLLNSESLSSEVKNLIHLWLKYYIFLFKAEESKKFLNAIIKELKK